MSSVTVTSTPVAVKAPADCSGVRVQQQQGSDPPSAKFQVYAPDGTTLLSTQQPGTNYEFLPAGTPGNQAFASGQIVGYLKVASGTFTFTVLAEPLAPLNVGAAVNALLFEGPQQDSVAQTVIVTGSTAAAITAKSGIVILDCASAATALTIADPIAGADDGKLLTIIDIVGKADIITDATSGFNGKGSSGTLTFTDAKPGQAVQLVAYGGLWYTTFIASTVAAG